MIQPDVNLFAVLAASVVSMIIGFLWYSQAVFGRIWAELSGFTKKDMEKAKHKGMGKTFIFSFISVLVMTYILGHFVDYVEATTFGGGIELGFWLWLGFIAPVQLGDVLWKGNPFKLYVINTLHYLVCLIISAGILAVWV